MARFRVQSTAIGQSGAALRVLPGATISVTKPDGTDADIFSLESDEVSSGGTSAAEAGTGAYDFYLSADEEYYDIVVEDSAGALVDQRVYSPAQIGSPRVVTPFRSRADFVSWAGTVNPSVGASINAAGLGYVFDGTTTVLSDLSGWAPVAPVQPEHLGALGSGGGDDITQINGAIQYVIGQGGGTVKMPGSYRISAPILLNQTGIILQGGGSGKTIITMTDSSLPAIVVAGDDPFNGDIIYRTHVRDVAIRCTASNPTAAVGVRFDRVSDCTASDVYVYNCWRNFEILGTGASVRISRCYSTQGANITGAVIAGSAGIHIGRRQVAMGVASSYLDTNDSLYYVEPNSVHISDTNVRKANSKNGMVNGVFIDCADGIYATNNHFNGGTNAAVRIQPPQPTIGNTTYFFSNTLFDPIPGQGDYGIDISSAIDNNLNHIHISNCGIAGPDKAGIRVAAAVRSLTFTGGSIKACGEQGILVNHALAQNLKFTDLDIYKTNVSAGTNAAVRLNECDGFTLENCSIYDGYRGVWVDADVNLTKVRIDNNDFYDMSNASIYVAASIDPSNRIGRNTVTEAATVAATSTTALPPGIVDMSITGTGTIATIKATSGATTSCSWEGRNVTLYFAAAATVANATGNIRLNGATNFVAAAGSTLSLIYRGSTWYEVGRCA